MSLKESGEMYLESIYVLSREKGKVRSVDVAGHMNFSKPSVSRGIGILKQQEYISVDKDGYIVLTDAGERAAEKIFERHSILTEFLISLGVSEAVATDDACRIEHVISDDTLDAIKKNLKTK
jgi:Mn-dependent DtxR family transcriptional regulator